MNVNPYNTTDYENKSNWTLGENNYRKKDDFAVRKNKPNSNPISEKSKMNVTSILTKDYENVLCRKLQKNKPKQSQFQTRSEAEIPTGELLGILKPGTNFKPSASLSRHTKNFSRSH